MTAGYEPTGAWWTNYTTPQVTGCFDIFWSDEALQQAIAALPPRARSGHTAALLAALGELRALVADLLRDAGFVDIEIHHVDGDAPPVSLDGGTGFRAWHWP